MRNEELGMRNVRNFFFAVLFLAMAGCGPDPYYIRVVHITDVPETGTAGTPLALTGTVRPVFASNIDIIWFVKDTGTTGTVIRGNILYANADGTVVITAIISNGRAAGKDYTQDFRIVIGTGGQIKDKEYTIKIDIIDNVTGDMLTASPDRGVEGATVTLNYTVADTAHYNQLDFGGITEAIASVEEAGSGTRTYTINAADSSNGVITITAVFTHTDLEIDHIAFSEHNEGHITMTYGDESFNNAITSAHKGSGAITYHSSDTSVAMVDDSGQVTILKVGSTVISAEKAADAVYAHAQTTYTLTVDPKPVTITGLSAEDKVYDGTTTATVTGTAVIDGKLDSDEVIVIEGTASFEDADVGDNKIVTFNDWSLDGADADNYTLSAQPEPVTANITNPSVEIVIDWTNIDEWTLIEQTIQVKANEERKFTVAGSYTADHTYRWYLDGVLVETSSTYTFKQPADVYQLVVVVTNSSGESRSGRCRVTVSE
jgi:hypothetical protein